MGDLQFEHHDGDDDGDDSVGEGFEAGCCEDVMGHGWLGCLLSLAEGYNGDCE